MNLKKLKKPIMKDEKLAELIGVLQGDGHLGIYNSDKKGNTYSLFITGNKTEELDYFDFLKKLIKEIFDEEPKFYIKKDSICLQLCSKEIVLFLNSLGVHIGKKSHKLRIPKWIKKDLRYTRSFIRGLADTDFCLTFKKGGRRRNSYPVITGYFSSFEFVNEIANSLKKIGLKGNIIKTVNDYYNTNSTQYRIELNGKEKLLTWLSNIGFSNLKHKTKSFVWEKLGYCPPNSTIAERKSLLKSKNT